MTDRFWPAFFWVAAAYNFLAGLPPLLMPTLSTVNAGLPPLDPRHTILVQMMGLLICIFGVGYAMVASGSPAARQIVLLGFVGKLGVCVLVALRLREIEVPTAMLLAAAGDFLFLIVFIVFLTRAIRGPTAA